MKRLSPAGGADRVQGRGLFDSLSTGGLSKGIRADSVGEKMRSIVHFVLGVPVLFAMAFSAGATGTNKLCNGRETDIVFAVIHEDSNDSGSRCELQESRCHVTLQGWYTMKPGVCMDVDVGTRWESYLSIFVKETAAGQYRPEAFPVNERFHKDRNEKNSGVVNASACMPAGPFKKKLPGALAPMLNSAVACDSGETPHPVNYVMRGGPQTHVVVTLK
jgi:hypothetical protein